MICRDAQIGRLSCCVFLLYPTPIYSICSIGKSYCHTNHFNRILIIDKPDDPVGMFYACEEVACNVSALVNHWYKTGTINKVKKVEEIIPPIIVQPNGDQSWVCCSVSGNKPKIVVPVVSIIGVNLVSHDLSKASFTEAPFFMSWFA